MKKKRIFEKCPQKPIFWTKTINFPHRPKCPQKQLIKKKNIKNDH